MGGASCGSLRQQALARLKPAVNVIVVSAAAENMLGSRRAAATDVITIYGGDYGRGVNTGRGRALVPRYALASRGGWPDIPCDIATLTGAPVVALGTGQRRDGQRAVVRGCDCGRRQRGRAGGHVATRA